MNKDSILTQIDRINTQISTLLERSYNPELSTSEQKEISKRKKKLDKTRRKLNKRLDSV